MISRNSNQNQAVQTIENGPSKELTEEKNGGIARRYFQVCTECLALVLLRVRWGAKGTKIPIYLIGNTVGRDGRWLQPDP